MRHLFKCSECGGFFEKEGIETSCNSCANQKKSDEVSALGITDVNDTSVDDFGKTEVLKEKKKATKKK